MAMNSQKSLWLQQYAKYHSSVELDLTDEEIKEFKKLERHYKLMQMELDSDLDKKEFETLKGSLHAYHRMAGGSTHELIEYMATALAFQYKLNREYKQSISDLLLSQRRMERRLKKNGNM